MVAHAYIKIVFNENRFDGAKTFLDFNERHKPFINQYRSLTLRYNYDVIGHYSKASVARTRCRVRCRFVPLVAPCGISPRPPPSPAASSTSVRTLRLQANRYD